MITSAKKKRNLNLVFLFWEFLFLIFVFSWQNQEGAAQPLPKGVKRCIITVKRWPDTGYR